MSQTGVAASSAVAPLVVTTVVARGTTGWPALAGLFVAAGLGLVLLVHRTAPGDGRAVAAEPVPAT